MESPQRKLEYPECVHKCLPDIYIVCHTAAWAIVIRLVPTWDKFMFSNVNCVCSGGTVSEWSPRLDPMNFSDWPASLKLVYGNMKYGIHLWMLWPYLELQGMRTNLTSDVWIDSLKTGHNVQCFADHTLNQIYPMRISVFWFIFHWCIRLLKMGQWWFRSLAWRRMDGKPLPEPMMTHYIDVYASMS